MGIHYQSEFQGVKEYSHYPFMNSVDIPTDFILDASLCKNIKLKSTDHEYVYFDDNSRCPNKSGIQKITIAAPGSNGGTPEVPLIVGYIEIGTPIYFKEFENAEFLGQCINHQNYINSINGLTNIIQLVEGYNIEILEENNIIEINSNRGAGMGEYCGADKFQDAIYSINSVKPDRTGNLQWKELGFFRIVPDPNSFTLFFDMLVPADLCIRHMLYTPVVEGQSVIFENKDIINALDNVDEYCYVRGFKGKPGPKGPSGVPGKQADPAEELDVEFEGC